MICKKSQWTDKKWQEYLREKNPYCLICGDIISCHHHFLHKGKYPQLRYEETNMIGLCTLHHLQIHSNRRKDLDNIIINRKSIEWYKNLIKLSNK